MAKWDVFHGEGLKLEHGLTTSAVREALARGTLVENDLVRPAGTATPWVRLAEIAALVEPALPSPSPPEPAPPALAGANPPAEKSPGPMTQPRDDGFVEPQEIGEAVIDLDDLENVEAEAGLMADAGFTVATERVEKTGPGSSSSGTLPVDGSGRRDHPGALAVVADEEAFSLSRSGPLTVEELDLAPMVDVAFQLVLFFMVAAQTIVYKTLEVPKPTTEQAPAVVAQGRSRTLDDLQDDYILVEIDSSGAIKLDRQPIAADMTMLVERLRAAREATRRKAMLLSADFATPHRSAVLAYDAANEIGLGIVIARPTPPRGPAPTLHQGQPAAGSTPN